MQADFLQDSKLFSQASKLSLQQILYFAKQRSYKKGTLVLDRYQSPQTFLYVIDGWVKLFKESADGDEIIIDVLTQHHYCGEAFLFKFHEEEAYAAQSISDLEIFTMLAVTVLKPFKGAYGA